MNGYRSDDRDYDDVRLDHPWTDGEGLRIPVLEGFYPHWRYEVALAVPESEFDNPKMLWPTEEEAKIVSALIDARCEGQYGTHHREKMRARRFDTDSGTNTLIVVKTAEGWAYRRNSWTMGAFLAYSSNKSLDINGLLTMLEEIAVFRWEEWKAENPGRIPEVA